MKSGRTERHYEALEDIFINKVAYIGIMNLLYHHGIVDDRGKWIDRSKGHKNKTVILMYHLWSKNYIHKPKLQEVKSIVLNTFGVEISKGQGSIHRTKLYYSWNELYNFIPQSAAFDGSSDMLMKVKRISHQ